MGMNRVKLLQLMTGHEGDKTMCAMHANLQAC